MEAWEASLQQPTVSKELRSAFIRKWVEDELIVNAAVERGLDDDPWVQSRLDELSRRLLTSRILELETTGLPNVAPGAVVDYYRTHSNEFLWQKLHLNVKYWQSATRAPLDRIRQELVSSRAAPASPGQYAAVDTGSFEIDDPSAVDPASWKLFGWMKEGQIGYPTYHRTNYWMFRVVQRNEPNTQQSLDDVKDIIQARLMEVERLNTRDMIVSRVASRYLAENKLYWPDGYAGHANADSTRKHGTLTQE